MSARIKMCVASKIPDLYTLVSKRIQNADIYSLYVKNEDSFLIPEDLSEENIREIRDCQVILADPDVLPRYDLIYRLPKLEWFQSTWAGVDCLINPEKIKPNFTITRFAGYFGPIMAEYVIGHIIAHERQFFDTKVDQMKCRWNTERGVYRVLPELSIGILGVGDIGRGIAKFCKAFGMTVWGVGRSEIHSNSSDLDHFLTTDQISTVVRECDYVCNVLPDTSKTTGLINLDLLEHGKHKRTVFINIGRGNVTTEEALLKSLERGYLSHAILDVFEKEPLSVHSPLWKHPNVTISPHVSGMSTGQPVCDLFLENFRRYCSGEQLAHVVDWEVGY